MEGNRRGKGRVHLTISRKERHSFGPSQYEVQSVSYTNGQDSVQLYAEQVWPTIKQHPSQRNLRPHSISHVPRLRRA